MWSTNVAYNLLINKALAVSEYQSAFNFADLSFNYETIIAISMHTTQRETCTYYTIS